MRRVGVLAAVAVAAAACAAALPAATPSLHVVLDAPGHHPRIGVRWPYTVHATLGGKPATARLTAVIVDPLGGVHAVERGVGTRKIVRWPFHGVFHDFLVWPGSSRGVPVTFRLTVTAGGLTRTIRYPVVPQG